MTEPRVMPEPSSDCEELGGLAIDRVRVNVAIQKVIPEREPLGDERIGSVCIKRMIIHSLFVHAEHGMSILGHSDVRGIARQQALADLALLNSKHMCKMIAQRLTVSFTVVHTHQRLKKFRAVTQILVNRPDFED